MKLFNDSIDISVIVPTYNRSLLLDYTLRSLELQDLDKKRFEVVIADDGSSDDTREIMSRYEQKLQIKYTFQDDKGYRVASARNMAIGVARGRLCLFIDSGILLNNDCLCRHIEFHDINGPDVAAVGYVYGFDRVDEAEANLFKLINPADPADSIRELSRHAVYNDVREPHYRNHNDQICDLPAPWLYFWTGNVSISRDNLLKVGMFDQAYDGRWGVEDNDLGFRLNRAGVKIHLLRSATCIHYPHINVKPDKVVQGKQNCAYFHNKFKTLETGLFLKHYGEVEFVDINLAILTMPARETI